MSSGLIDYPKIEKEVRPIQHEELQRTPLKGKPDKTETYTRVNI
jgi:hypothetical protein